MSSRTFEILKTLRNKKKNKNKYLSKKREGQILSELKVKLDEYLSENNKVMLEIDPQVVGDFLNILTDSLLTMYSYEQIDSNKYIFSNREIKF